MSLVDFHSHILPKADHGSDSIDVSLTQLNLARKYGVKDIIATPHFYANKINVDRFVELRDKSYRSLIDSVKIEIPTIYLGAEVFYCKNIEQMPDLDKLCIGNSNMILIELPFGDCADECAKSVRNLLSMGYKVVLAHIERYSFDLIEQLIDLGAYAQLNSRILTKFFARSKYLKFLESRKIIGIGSDIHGCDEKAYKKFASTRAFIEKKYPYLLDLSDEICSQIK